MPRPSLNSKSDLQVRKRIHRKMLLGRKAGSEASVGRKPFVGFPSKSVQPGLPCARWKGSSPPN
jgi:hypothetical protein